jgi:hypothetical protein
MFNSWFVVFPKKEPVHSRDHYIKFPVLLHSSQTTRQSVPWRYQGEIPRWSCRGFLLSTGVTQEKTPFLCDSSARINALLAQQPIPPENSMGCLGAGPKSIFANQFYWEVK